MHKEVTTTIKIVNYKAVHMYMSLMPRTAGAIALHPMSNAQGSHYFLNMHLGKPIIRNYWTVLPMPAEVISTIHRLQISCKKIKCSPTMVEMS